MNKKIEDLAAVFLQNTPGFLTQQAVNDFAVNIVKDILQHINSTPTQQLTKTTFDQQLVSATKQQITKYIRAQYGLTSN